MGVGGSHLSPGDENAGHEPAGGAPTASSRRIGTPQEGPRKSSKAMAARGKRGAGGLLSSLWGGFAALESAPPQSGKGGEAEPRELAAESRVWAFNYEDSEGGPEEDRKCALLSSLPICEPSRRNAVEADSCVRACNHESAKGRASREQKI
jgi:hypothetical protein